MEIKSNVLEEYKIKIEESQGIKMIFVYNKDDKYIGTLKDFEMYIENMDFHKSKHTMIKKFVQ